MLRAVAQTLTHSDFILTVHMFLIKTHGNFRESPSRSGRLTCTVRMRQCTSPSTRGHCHGRCSGPIPPGYRQHSGPPSYDTDCSYTSVCRWDTTMSTKKRTIFNVGEQMFCYSTTLVHLLLNQNSPYFYLLPSQNSPCLYRQLYGTDL